MTNALLAAIAVGVWVMAAESVVFAALRLRERRRQLRAAAALLRERNEERLLQDARERQGYERRSPHE